MIRYDAKLTTELNRVVKNYNAKVTRLEKKNIEAEEKVSIKSLKRKFKTRRELLRELKYMQEYSRRGSENLIVLKDKTTISEYQVFRLKKDITRSKKILSRQIKLEGSKPFIFEGRKTSATVAEMGTNEYKNLVERRRRLNKPILKMTQADILKFKQRNKNIKFGYTEADKSFYWNYWEIITELAKFYGYPTEKLETIRKTLYSLDVNSFVLAFKQERLLEDIVSYYVSILDDNRDTAGKDTIFELLDELYNKKDEIVDRYSR